MPRMPNAYPLLVRVLVSITAKPEHNPLIPGMTHAQRFEKKKNRDLSANHPPLPSLKHCHVFRNRIILAFVAL